jgi:hypothetical protein
MVTSSVYNKALMLFSVESHDSLSARRNGTYRGRKCHISYKDFNMAFAFGLRETAINLIQALWLRPKLLISKNNLESFVSTTFPSGFLKEREEKRFKSTPPSLVIYKRCCANRGHVHPSSYNCQCHEASNYRASHKVMEIIF